jgi:hypothetical protein
MPSQEEWKKLSDGMNLNLLFHEGTIGMAMALSSGDDIALSERLLSFNSRFFGVVGGAASVGLGYAQEGWYGGAKGLASFGRVSRLGGSPERRPPAR